MGSGLKMVLGALAGLFIMLIAGSSDQATAQQCCTPPPTCCTPPPTCCTPPTPPPCCVPPTPPTPPTTPCCTPPGHTINVPGVNVNVNASVIVNAAVNVRANAAAASQGSAGAFGGALGQTIVVGGGGIAPGVVTVIGGLNVQGGKEKRRVAYQAQRTKTTRIVIQAFCLDDKSVPHPASQVFPEKDVEDSYEGELYRCIAGTRMQYVWVEYVAGRTGFDGGTTVTCSKDNALWRGRDGKLECKAQKAERDCNERSLLRRFGAGVKVVTVIITETYTAYREEEVESVASSSSSMSFSGGVGGIAY